MDVLMFQSHHDQLTFATNGSDTDTSGYYYTRTHQVLLELDDKWWPDKLCHFFFRFLCVGFFFSSAYENGANDMISEWTFLGSN
jgi:hypothetical protein